ncbi:MAG TPA: acetylglutamate kinase, partial [Ferruginibacter sp.]|nr:acetylglutamate kinase [Ferruginibacter sp.]
DSVINHVDEAAFAEMKEKGAVSAGMIPKLQNAFAALDAGVQSVVIGHADNLPQLVNQQGGTFIKK